MSSLHTGRNVKMQTPPTWIEFSTNYTALDVSGSRALPGRGCHPAEEDICRIKHWSETV